MDSHSKTMASFFLAFLLILGSWPDDVRARYLLSNVADLASTSLSSEKGLRATKMEPFKKCPRQPGCTECGYFVLKFMREIVKRGVRALENDNIGGDSNEYTDADFDDIREEWAIYVSNFIFR
ncbi:hypothetical protein CTI12_AA558340 [Artemisia annua]|uniref:Ubiquitin-like protease family profile domain-containing protein n=1 Tax=Artemisia annua TaxID=35608 RepID=A0A2U1KVM3_ARTAN|nr:hypothetical protein CTI12_AA558340 [Artemisia annua]